MKTVRIENLGFIYFALLLVTMGLAIVSFSISMHANTVSEHCYAAP
jgi:hypothetical protein